MNKSIFHVFFMNVLCFSLARAAFTSLAVPICKDISRADPTNVNYESCISILGSDPRSSRSTAPQLAQISFELGISRAKAIISTIDKHLNLSRSDPSARKALKDCLVIYSRVPGYLESGLEAIKGRNFDVANARVSAAMNATSTCGNGIKEKGGNTAFLRNKINKFHQLGAISLGFTKLLRIIN